jgi:thiosulfate/3-mercaptopyruvate sulfurtransferase
VFDGIYNVDFNEEVAAFSTIRVIVVVAAGQPAKGRCDYLAHIPGAVYAHLDEDLSSPPLPGKTGRHPLPASEDFAAQLSAWGIDDQVQVVVYDDASSVYAGRLWWMLRWLGHDAVAVLDGDWRAWQAEERPTRGGAEQRAPRAFTPRPRPQLQATVDELMQRRDDPTLRLFDALDRYRGENETIDPAPGTFRSSQRRAESGRRAFSRRELTNYESLLEDAAPMAIFIVAPASVLI